MSGAPRRTTGNLQTTTSGIVFVERENHALIPLLDADGKRRSDLWVGLGAFFDPLPDLDEAVVTVGEHTASFEALDCGIERMLVCRAHRADMVIRPDAQDAAEALGKVWADIANGYGRMMRERCAAGARPSLPPARAYRWDEFEQRLFDFHDLMDGFEDLDWLGNPGMTRRLREFDVVGALDWQPAAVVSLHHTRLDRNEEAERFRARQWVLDHLSRPSHLVPGDYWLFADERDAVHFLLCHT